MTKTITAFICAIVLLCNNMSGQCTSDPEQGLLITKANFLCGDVMNGYQGTLPSSNSPVIGQPASLCEGFPGGGGQADNVLWFTFIATSFSLDIDIHYSNCGSNPNAGIQVGIYGDEEFNEPIVCNSFPVASPANLASSSIVPGKIYYLYIDGYESAPCDFRIEVDEGVTDQPYTFDWKDGISGISTLEDNILVEGTHDVCSGNNIVYTYEAPICDARSGPLAVDNFSTLDLFCYEWTIEPAGSGVILGDANAREIEVDWQSAGDYTLSVEIFPLGGIALCNPDVCLDADSILITSRDIAPMTAPDTIYFCADDPYLYCGELITETGSRVCIENTSNCIEVMQEFVLLVNDTIEHGTFVNCGSSGCFELFGFEYCTPMEYVIQDPDSCHRQHRFTVEGFNIDIDLPATLSLDCANNDLILAPDIETNYTGTIVTEWYSAGVLVGSDPTLSVTGIGSYEIRVTFPNLESSCVGSETVQIVESVDAPAFTIINPVLTCDNPNGTVEFVAVDVVDSILWEGPNGFSNTNNSFTTNLAGSYKLSIVGSNGCTSDTTFVVSEDIGGPVVQLVDYEDLTCIVVATKATFEADREIIRVDWVRNDGTEVTADTLDISSPGNYQATFTASNGCSTVVPFAVQENVDMPTADAGMDQMWQCNTQQLSLEGAISSGPNDIRWSVVEQGLIKTDASSSRIDVGSEGTYILNVINRVSGCEVSDSVTVFRNEDVPDSMETTVVDPSCFATTDGIIQVVNVDGGTEPFRYFLNGIEAESDFMDELSAGVYSVQVLDNFDCRLEVSVEVIEQQEIVLDMPASVTIGYSELYTFQAMHNLAAEDVQSISWFDASQNLIGEGDSLLFKTIENTTISVEVFNLNGCSTVRSIPIEVDINVPVYAPNAFSPDGDGFNDIFTLYANNEYPTQVNSLSIFNRWGEEIYQVDNLDFGDEDRGWDGTRNGKQLQSAVFVYSAEVTLVDGTTKLVKGEVLLIR